MRLHLAVLAVFAGCTPHAAPPGPELGTTHGAPSRREPTGPECLTHEDVGPVLATLHTSTAPASGELRLASAECHKRVYVQGTARFIVWGPRDQLHGKGSTTMDPLPTAPCIERALTLARELAPFGETILRREAARNAKLWRDPEVGAVSYVRCDPHDEPVFTSVGTMLHETNHALAQGACIFDFSANRELCLELDRALPPGSIAAYPAAPASLDAEGAKWLAHVQTLYLDRNHQGLLELLDEVMAYRASAEWTAVGLATQRFTATGAPSFVNLPLMMALITRYVNECARRDPALWAKELGPNGRHRAAILAILDGAEASYLRWLAEAKTPGSFERTFWDDYQAGRRQWLAP